jgi:hypothetical protein
VERILPESQGVAHSDERANAWALAFADEDDPTYSVLEWTEAGWREPLVVDAALRICGNRATAEECMALLGRAPGDEYDYALPADLARAMIGLKKKGPRRSGA